MHDFSDFPYLWQSMFLPLVKLLAGMAAGLFLAIFLEYMGWARILTVLLGPLARAGNLGETACASFGLAFISPSAANALLSEAWRKRELNRRELTLAVICNSLPASFAHLPTLFFLAWPAIGAWAFALAAVNLAVGAARSLVALLAGRLLLPKRQNMAVFPVLQNKKEASGRERLRSAWQKASRIFRKRALRLVLFTIPVFVLVWLAREAGFFECAKNWMLEHLDWAPFLEPASIGIVMLQVLAETGASLGAANALLETGAITGKQAIAALLLGGLLATPLRAIRHQLPSMAGFFDPGLAIWLVLANQGSRALFMACALLLFF